MAPPTPPLGASRRRVGRNLANCGRAEADIRMSAFLLEMVLVLLDGHSIGSRVLSILPVSLYGVGAANIISLVARWNVWGEGGGMCHIPRAFAGWSSICVALVLQEQSQGGTLSRWRYDCPSQKRKW